jgi:hypothetical protein
MLFRRFQIERESIECALGRRLTGDPSRGERAILALLNRGRLRETRERLLGDVGADFRSFVADHMRAAQLEWERGRSFRVHLRPDVWMSYLEEAWSAGDTLDRVLSAAIERDFEHRKKAP